MSDSEAKSQIEAIENSFDVDVVGLSDIPEFTSDGDLMLEFESSDFSLFGGESHRLSAMRGEKSLPQSSSIKSSQRDSEPPSTKVKRNSKKSQWNEKEKEKFYQGLERFGENWKMISKMIPGKTTQQVKMFHKHQSKVNQGDSTIDKGNFTFKSSPVLTTDEDEICVKGPRLGTAQSTTSFPSLSVGNYTTILNDRILETEGQGIVVSPLNDWDLGSQVSITEEIIEPSMKEGDLVAPSYSNFLPSNQLHINESKLARKQKSCVRGKSKNIFVKSPLNYKSKKRKKNKSLKPVKSALQNEGQLIRLDKSTTDLDEESDVDIDDSIEECARNSVEECSPFQEASNAGTDQSTKDPEPSDEKREKELFYAFPEEERMFYIDSLAIEKDMSLSLFILIRTQVIKLWHQFKPHILTKNQTLNSLRHLNVDYFIHRIYDFLESNKSINCNSKPETPKKIGEKNTISNRKVLPKRQRNSTSKALKEFGLHLDVSKRGGGITMSHDHSGAVINALHIPDTSSNACSRQGKEKSHDTKNCKLISVLDYESTALAPFTVSILPIALLSLDVHSHSSLHEVIGLLGGYLDDMTRTLHITHAVPTEASTSNTHCDMCPLSQAKALETIRQSGSSIVGWYHSHPRFLPNPSQRDIDTQSQLQSWFRRNDAPFVGLIITSFGHTATFESSIINCFVLDTPWSHSPSASLDTPRRTTTEAERPYKVEWKVAPSGIHMERREVETVLNRIANCKSEFSSRNEWTSEWTSSGLTFGQKLVKSLQSLLKLNHDVILAYLKDFLENS